MTITITDPHDVMDLVLRREDTNELARRLCCSPQLIRAWKRRPETPEEYQNTGRPGPLQRLDDIIDHIRLADSGPDRAQPIARHVAQRCGGYFIPSPVVGCEDDSTILARVSSVLKEVGEAVEAVRAAWLEKSPARITAQEHALSAREIEEAMVALAQLHRFVKDKAERE